jgi:hypothetical protein
MPDIIIDRAVINLTLLDAELRAALGKAMTGISTRAGVVIVHLAKTATGDHETQAKLLVQAHNATALTPEQQTQKTRVERLQTDRARFTAPLNPSDFTANPVLQTLATRIAWLEQELRDLRGL